MTENQMKKRNERIVKMYKKVLSIRKVAAKVGLSKTRVGEILQECR